MPIDLITILSNFEGVNPFEGSSFIGANFKGANLSGGNHNSNFQI